MVEEGFVVESVCAVHGGVCFVSSDAGVVPLGVGEVERGARESDQPAE